MCQRVGRYAEGLAPDDLLSSPEIRRQGAMERRAAIAPSLGGGSIMHSGEALHVGIKLTHNP
jgi:hypothetical protein